MNPLQEEIASRIGHKKIVWPWWLATAAAAAILAAVLLSPVLFSGKEELVAITDAPKNIMGATEHIHPSSSPLLGEGDPRNEGGGVCLTNNKHTPPSALRAATPSLPGSKGDMACDRSGANLEGELADAIIGETITISTLDSTLMASPTTPRVHTRRSNRLGDVRKAPEKPQVPALIAHYLNIPDTVLFTSNIVINLK